MLPAPEVITKDAIDDEGVGPFYLHLLDAGSQRLKIAIS